MLDQPDHHELEQGASPRGSKRRSAAIRFLLGGILAFGALNAFGGGYYGLAGAEGIPTEWLAGSPFTSYFVPSIVLFVVVGGAFLIAAVAVLACWRAARMLALAAGVVVLGWIAVQIAIIGYVSWMQPATAIAGIIVLVLAWALSSATGARRGSMRVRRA